MAESTDEVLGKIIAVRDMRRTRFVDVYTPDSDKLQLMVPRDIYGEGLTQGDSILAEGTHGESKTGEPSFMVSKVLHRTPYVSDIPFVEVERTNKAELLRRVSTVESIRNYMRHRELIEVTTATIVNKFNGGSSIPMRILGQHEYGFLRATHEDQLLKIVTDLLCSVYQIGSIYKAGKEIDFLEAYIIDTDYDAINSFVQDFIQKVVGVAVEYVDFIDLLKKHLSEEDFRLTVDYLNGTTTDIPQIASIASKTSVGFCDKIVSMVAKSESEWVAVKYLAAAHSPLYQEVGEKNGLLRIERSRIYRNGKVVCDIGVNSLDAESVIHRVRQANDNIESPYIEVLRQGLPPVAGFSVRLSELM